MKTRKVVLMSLLIGLVIIFTLSADAEVNLSEDVNVVDGCVVFGSYEQWDCHIDERLIDIYNGDEPIQWIPLDSDGTKVLLVSKYPLEYLQYNKDRIDFTWKGSSIRTWLNAAFINKAFSEDERAAILTTTVETGPEKIDEKWPATPKETTQDRLFLLSYSELKKYLKDDKVELNEYVGPKSGTIFSDDNSWWLRSSGKKTDEACFVGHGKYESGWLSDWRCIRPAMWIDTSLFDWNNSMYSKLLKADQLYEDKKYAEAYEQLDSLGTYSSSEIISASIRYKYACEAYNNEEYNIAIERMQDLKDYINSHFIREGDEEETKQERNIMLQFLSVYEGIIECKYQYAVQLKEKGDILAAIDAFISTGQYKDSMVYLRECFDKEHIQYSWLTRPDAAINAGLDKEYSEKHEITGNDPHFGWSLGRFMMSGYTEVKQEGEVPVFMKTPGDSMILWFDLEQDISALNGKKELSINVDKNGSDRQFQIEKSDFGRGTLIIRHVDFRNSVSKPQIYTDYLAAHEDTGANTRIEIKEEGIYEVALDYEVRKDELIDKYFNYRISFSFEVRNGSGMFFMFDTATGSELQDYSTTADGFRIDLANSHSLSISYTRYAINQEETGLDVRKTGLCSDGDVFEKVGYYVITVTNKETNEELTKHIFVGRNADLEEYMAVDESLSKFSK